MCCIQNIGDVSSSTLSEFVPLPSRLSSSPLLYSRSSSRFDDGSTLARRRHSPQSSTATELTHDNAVVVRRHRAKYYNSWMSNHSARKIDGTDAGRLERLRSLSPGDGDSASEDSSSVLSSSSYEHLDDQRADADNITEFGEQRFVGTSPAANDCQSLVSVTPEVDSLSTTSTSSSPVSDPDDSLSDAASLYTKEDVWSWTRSRCRSAGNDFVVKRRHRADKRVVANEQYLPAVVDVREKDVAEYQTFDGKEIATIRMLELELLAADLSKQMTSMHKLMRLLSCETSQLADLIDDERRHGARRERLELSNDEEELGQDRTTAVVDESGDDVSTQKVLLSAVIDELKSVSMMMSNTLESVTASRSPSVSILTAHDSTARNNDDNNNYDENNTTESDEACQLPTPDSHDEQCRCLSAAATDDDDDNNDTCTTEVSIFLLMVAVA